MYYICITKILNALRIWSLDYITKKWGVISRLLW